MVIRSIFPGSQPTSLGTGSSPPQSLRRSFLGGPGPLSPSLSEVPLAVSFRNRKETAKGTSDNEGDKGPGPPRKLRRRDCGGDDPVPKLVGCDPGKIDLITMVDETGTRYQYSNARR